MCRIQCQTASSTPQQRNLRGIDRIKVITHARLKLGKTLLLALPRTEKNDFEESFRQLHLQFIDASEEQSHSENTGACGKVKRQHLDKIAEYRCLGSFTLACHFGLVHKPVSFQEAMKIPQAKAAVGKEWNNLKKQLQRGTKRKFDQSLKSIVSEEGWKNSSLRELAGTLSFEESRLPKHLQKYKERIVLGGGNVKDEEGHRAAFTEQGASASQKAAAKFLDTI